MHEENDRKTFELPHEKACLMSYANNKGTDQPAHSRSLISAFVVHCLASTIPILAKSKISRLASSWAGWFESYLVAHLRRQVFSWVAHFFQFDLISSENQSKQKIQKQLGMTLTLQTYHSHHASLPSHDSSFHFLFLVAWYHFLFLSDWYHFLLSWNHSLLDCSSNPLD